MVRRDFGRRARILVLEGFWPGEILEEEFWLEGKGNITMMIGATLSNDMIIIFFYTDSMSASSSQNALRL